MRCIHIVDRVATILEVSKMIYIEVSRAKSEECLENVLKYVVNFISDFEQMVRDKFPNYWDPIGELIP